MQSNSKAIVSNQQGIHPDLYKLIVRHQRDEYLQPFRPFSEQLFSDIDQLQQTINKPLILDSGCGNGTSSYQLAKMYPEHLVIGIDKSEYRLQHHIQRNDFHHEKNLLLLRAELIDFWRLAVEAGWQLSHHYLLYPNPWPKKKHIQRRWHGHAVFPSLLKLGGQLECRSNWSIYIEEMAAALKHYGFDAHTDCFKPTEFISPFEQKYHMSGHLLYKLKINL